jgi:alpha-glucosidase (family GH31 glycosyl hydrolase)
MRKRLLSGVVILTIIQISLTVSAGPVQYRGAAAELTVYQVSDKTIGFKLSPLDPNGKVEPLPASTMLVDFPRKVLLQKKDINTTEKLSVGNLSITISPSPLKIVVSRAGKTIQELTWTEPNVMSFQMNGPVLGLGEGEKQFDRRGMLHPMDFRWNSGMYGSTVSSPLAIGTEGWALFVHTPQVAFDLRGKTGNFFVQPKLPGNGLEFFVIAWQQPADVLAEYDRLTGTPVVPPKWTMGYMQSHRTLAGPNEVMEVAKTFRDKQLPIDALIYLGTGYCPNGWNTGHASLDFNPKAFDKPAEMISELIKEHFQIVLHINQPPRRLFGLSINETSDSPNHISNYWKRHIQTFALGVAGWWPDDGDELPQEAKLARHRAYYEGPLSSRPNVRPWNLQRTGVAGVQRYGGWIWSGDIDGRWATLKEQVSIGQNYSLSLTPFWGTDTGGFYPTRELTGELYVRWFQFSTFCPSFRSHGRTWHLRLPWGWNTGTLGVIEDNRRPDVNETHNPLVEPICKKYLELRYSLLTYNYGLCREARDTGLGLIRALWLYYNNDPVAVVRGDEYMWGPDFLVAPVTEKGAVEKKVYLPAGQWIDYWTKEKYSGGKEITRKVDLETIPLFVKAGAIVPFDPVRQYTDQPVDGPLTLRVYTGSDGSYKWYQDDGQSLNYQKGDFSFTNIKWNDKQRTLVIEPDAKAKSFGNWPKQIRVELVPDGKTQTIDWQGKKAELKF